MTTQEIKSRLYDIARETERLEAEILNAGREFEEIAYGIGPKEGGFAILNIVTGMKKAEMIIKGCIERHERYERLVVEKKELEFTLKGRE